MPAAASDNPERAQASGSLYSLREFMRDFPDDAACLEWLWRNRYAPDGHHAYCPKCCQKRKFHKVKERPAWDCDTCGHHLHPLAGTIFHKSSTSLHLWFFAVHLMTSTRCRVSAKQLERELGVTYKTAWRMFHLIRDKLMVEDASTLLQDGSAAEGSLHEPLGEPAAGGTRERNTRSRTAWSARKRTAHGVKPSRRRPSKIAGRSIARRSSAR